MTKDLNDIVGTDVYLIFQTYDDIKKEDLDLHIPCIIVDAWLETYFFEEKWNEPMFVRCNLQPLNENVINEMKIDYDEFNDVSLDLIIKR